MPRDPGTGSYSYPDGTKGNPGQTIFSGRYNTFLDDLKLTLNSPLPVNMGGTGSSTVSGALASLGVAAIKSQVTNYDALTGVAQGFIYSDTGATASPVSGHKFVGQYIWYDATVAPGAQPDNAMVIVWDQDEAAVAGSTAPRATWRREKKAGSWNNWTSQVTIEAGVEHPVLVLNKAAGSSATQQINSTVGGTLRWSIQPGTGADGGSNIGNDFHIYRFNDAGALLGDAFVISRATGAINLNGTTNITNGLNMASGSIITQPATSNISAGGPANTLEVRANAPTDPSIAFHRVGSFAMNFGMGSDSNLWFGGWSHGATAYKLWSTRDFNYRPVSSTGDTITGDLNVNRNNDTGYVWLGNGGSHYVGFDGGSYQMPNAYLFTAAGRTWGTNDFSYIPYSSGGGYVNGPIYTNQGRIGSVISTNSQPSVYVWAYPAGAAGMFMDINGRLAWGYTDGNGVPQNNLMRMDGSGNFDVNNGIDANSLHSRQTITAENSIALNGGYIYVNSPGNAHVEFRCNSAVRGYCYFDTGMDMVKIQHVGGLFAGVDGTGVLYTSRGYRCRQGNYGPTSNSYNIWWDGTPELFIDNTYIGDISTFICDYRVKENVNNLPSTWEHIKAMRPITYNYKAYGEVGETGKPMFQAREGLRWGFLAHEVQEALTEYAVTRPKDMPDALQTIDPLALMSALTKALQEAISRIETLEGQVASLNARFNQ